MNSEFPGREAMDPHGGSVAEDPTRPAMDPPEAIDPADPGGAAARSGGEMDEPPPANVPDANADYPEMQPADGPAGPESRASDYNAGPHGEAYLRLVVYVDHGRMSVVSASVVDGPLVEPELTGQMAYEALLGGRRIGAGAFDDLSWQHGFAPEDDKTRGHSHTELAKYSFVVRIPRGEVTLADLADVEVRLVRPATTTQLSEVVRSGPGVPFGVAASAARLEAPELVASLSGVDIEALPAHSAEEVRHGLR